MTRRRGRGRVGKGRSGEGECSTSINVNDLGQSREAKPRCARRVRANFWHSLHFRHVRFPLPKCFLHSLSSEVRALNSLVASRERSTLIHPYCHHLAAFWSNNPPPQVLVSCNSDASCIRIPPSDGLCTPSNTGTQEDRKKRQYYLSSPNTQTAIDEAHSIGPFTKVWYASDVPSTHRVATP